MLGVGAVFYFHTDNVKRAPKFFKISVLNGFKVLFLKEDQ